MKADAGLQANMCLNCGERLEQFLVKPIFSGCGNLQTINVGCPHCGAGADISVAELAQALVGQALKLPK